MKLEYQNNINFNVDNNDSLITMLNNIIQSLGEPISEEDFKSELNNYNMYKVQNTANSFMDECKDIVGKELKENIIDIIAEVSSVNEDGTINVIKPNGVNVSSQWTNIINPTIYTNLRKGDQVLLRCMNANQKSNMWVVSAKVSYNDFENRTIFKYINTIFNVSKNIQLLQKWMKILSEERGVL